MGVKRMTALLLTLCLLTGCSRTGTQTGRAAEELALQIRTEFIGMTACTASVDITADYGSRVYDFTVNVAYTAETGAVLTLVKPDMLAGVTARIHRGETVLEYDGASVETGPLTPVGLTPMEALPLIFAQVKTGYMAEMTLEPRGERTALRLLCRDPELPAGEGLEVGLTFDAETRAPVEAELFQDGSRVILCTFTAFSMEVTEKE